MGPRLQERGVQLDCFPIGLFSFRFNGAALTRARSYTSGSVLKPAGKVLQWGRAYKSAEFKKRKPLQKTGVNASMGPRLQERGVRPFERDFGLQLLCFNGAALTRARSCCGATASPNFWCCFNGAALTRARSYHRCIGETQEAHPLQWGRAYKSAEFIGAHKLFDTDLGFNGAALTRARSFQQWHERGLSSTFASMGPRLQERGVPASLSLPAKIVQGFNGAALTRARSCFPLAFRSPLHRSFNGAALTRARSWERSEARSGASGALQWGRAYKSAEFPDSRPRELEGQALQWGRAYKSAEFKIHLCGFAGGSGASMGPRLQERGV